MGQCKPPTSSFHAGGEYHCETLLVLPKCGRRLDCIIVIKIQRANHNLQNVGRGSAPLIAVAAQLLLHCKQASEGTPLRRRVQCG